MYKVFSPLLSLTFRFSRCSWSRGESELSLSPSGACVHEKRSGRRNRTPKKRRPQVAHTGLQHGAWSPQLRRLHSGADFVFEPLLQKDFSKWDWEEKGGGDGSQACMSLRRKLRWLRDVFDTSANSLVVFVQKNRREVWKASRGKSG